MQLIGNKESMATFLRLSERGDARRLTMQNCRTFQEARTAHRSPTGCTGLQPAANAPGTPVAGQSHTCSAAHNNLVTAIASLSGQPLAGRTPPVLSKCGMHTGTTTNIKLAMCPEMLNATADHVWQVEGREKCYRPEYASLGWCMHR